MGFLDKTIFTGFAPNMTGKDVAISLGFLLAPWYWRKIIVGENSAKAEKEIEKYFGIRSCSVFDSGRSALYFALRALDVREGDEVLVQGYTCMVVVNAIKWAGATPVFVDAEDDFNMSSEDLKKKISAKSKVLIVQHTFGLAADLEKLLPIAKKNGLKIVEDCAHCFGAKYDGKLLGTFGDVSVFSFGADKVLSSVRGGALIAEGGELSQKIKKLQTELQAPDLVKTIQHLMHSPIFWLGKKLYGIYVGKTILALAKKTNLMNKIIYAPEKHGEQVEFYPAKMANSLAALLLNQLKDVEKNNLHRQEIASFYEKEIDNKKIILPWRNKINQQNSIFLRYPLLMNDPKKLHALAKKNNIILGCWYDRVIAPTDIDFEKTGYMIGGCPNAEKLAARSINLPTDKNISLDDAKRIVKIVNEYK